MSTPTANPFEPEPDTKIKMENEPNTKTKVNTNRSRRLPVGAKEVEAKKKNKKKTKNQKVETTSAAHRKIQRLQELLTGRPYLLMVNRRDPKSASQKRHLLVTIDPTKSAKKLFGNFLKLDQSFATDKRVVVDGQPRWISSGFYDVVIGQNNAHIWVCLDDPADVALADQADRELAAKHASRAEQKAIRQKDSAVQLETFREALRRKRAEVKEAKNDHTGVILIRVCGNESRRSELERDNNLFVEIKFHATDEKIIYFRRLMSRNGVPSLDVLRCPGGIITANDALNWQIYSG